MDERGPGSGGRGGRGGRGQGTGQGMRRRRRDGSGGGACLSPSVRADVTDGEATAVIASAAGAEAFADASAVDRRARTVAVVKLESCIACGTCVDTCPRGAITLDETAVINASTCTGCGLCVSDCAYGALSLAEI